MKINNWSRLKKVPFHLLEIGDTFTNECGDLFIKTPLMSSKDYKNEVGNCIMLCNGLYGNIPSKSEVILVECEVNVRPR